MPESFGTREVLRALGGSEEFLWKSAQAGSRNFSVVVSFRGLQEEGAWRAALRQVQGRHPLLDAAVLRDGEAQRTPVFAKGSGEPIPLRRERRSSTTAWRDEAARELVTPFDATVAPLLRGVLLEDDDGCDLILTVFHSIGDGMSLLTVVGDLLAALAGETLSSLPLPASIEERLSQLPGSVETPKPAGAGQASGSGGGEQAREFRYRGVKEAPQMETLCLAETLTTKIVKAARMHEVTVGAALLTALSFASRTMSPALQGEEVQLLFPVDARGLVGNHGEFSYAVGVGRAAVPSSADDFWETARSLRPQLQASQSAESVGATLTVLAGMLAMNLDAGVMVASMARAGFDLYLSNLRTAEFRRVPQGLTVEALWGTGLILGLEGEQNIGTVTFGGALHLLNTSYTPIEGLFSAVQQILEDACAIED